MNHKRPEIGDLVFCIGYFEKPIGIIVGLDQDADPIVYTFKNGRKEPEYWRHVRHLKEY